jgi:phospholipid transport system substrate-binding protein
MLAQHDLNLGRRAALGLAVVAMITAVPCRPTLANAASTTPHAPIRRLNNALLAEKKSAASTSFEMRYRVLEPMADQAFNLDAVREASIGLSWVTMPNGQKTASVPAFRRYTVSSHVSNFHSHNAQKFDVLHTVRLVGNAEVIKRMQLIRTDLSPANLGYVTRQGPIGWQAVDLLADGSISRVAVQRSDTEVLLASDGKPAPGASLERKAVFLSVRAI